MTHGVDGLSEEQLGEATPLLGGSSSKKEAIDGVPQFESFGYLMLLFSSLGSSGLRLCLRVAMGYHAFPEPCVLLIRGLMQTALALVWLAASTDIRETLSIPSRDIGLLILRGLGGSSSMVLSLFALSRIPLGIQASLFFLSMLPPLPLLASDFSRPTHDTYISLLRCRSHLHDDLLELLSHRTDRAYGGRSRYLQLHRRRPGIKPASTARLLCGPVTRLCDWLSCRAHQRDCRRVDVLRGAHGQHARALHGVSFGARSRHLLLGRSSRRRQYVGDCCRFVRASPRAVWERFRTGWIVLP